MQSFQWSISTNLWTSSFELTIYEDSKLKGNSLITIYNYSSIIREFLQENLFTLQL